MEKCVEKQKASGRKTLLIGMRSSKKSGQANVLLSRLIEAVNHRRRLHRPAKQDLSVSHRGLCFRSWHGYLQVYEKKRPGSVKREMMGNGCCSQVHGSGLNEDGRDRVA